MTKNLQSREIDERLIALVKHTPSIFYIHLSTRGEALFNNCPLIHL